MTQIEIAERLAKQRNLDRQLARKVAAIFWKLPWPRFALALFTIASGTILWLQYFSSRPLPSPTLGVIASLILMISMVVLIGRDAERRLQRQVAAIAALTNSQPDAVTDGRARMAAGESHAVWTDWVPFFGRLFFWALLVVLSRNAHGISAWAPWALLAVALADLAWHARRMKLKK